jgi:hypothetical protein
MPCSEDQQKYPKKTIQIVYHRNYSTFRTHISCKDMASHYNKYRKGCIMKGIEMQERCMPPEEKKQLEGEAAGLADSKQVDG